MTGYLVRRLLSGMLLVVALTWIAFALFWLLPAQPWRAIVFDQNPTRAEIAAAGLDREAKISEGASAR